MVVAHQGGPLESSAFGVVAPVYATKAVDLRGSPAEQVHLCSSLGFDCTKRNNIHVLAPDVLVHSTGNTVQILDLKTQAQSYLRGLDGGGIGAIAVHPTRHCFAVCEKGARPNVYIYGYPNVRVIQTLQGGSERGYSAAVFSSDGTQLATVGSFPDFWLTVWDVARGEIRLRCKAFSREVTRVSFSEFHEGHMTTSGTGHVRFWRIAETFTGLKLQGDVGKFGSVEISDVAGFAELPNGKVLSGTESGSLLLWEGCLIEAEVTRTGGRRCHDGMIEVVQLQHSHVLTAGMDGYIRKWDLTLLDTTRLADSAHTLEINPLEEIQLGAGVMIKALVTEDDYWIVQDEAGSLLRISLPTYSTSTLRQFHSGPINGVDTSPVSHLAASAGEDGSIRLIDYRAGRIVYKRTFNAPATSVLWLPSEDDPYARTVLAGFADGVIRTLLRCSDAWKLTKVMKPHTKAVVDIALSPDYTCLASAAEDSRVFFFNANAGFQPIGYAVTPAPVTCIAWSPSSDKLLVGCSSGAILELQRPEALARDRLTTFQLSVITKRYSLRLAKEEFAEHTSLQNAGHHDMPVEHETANASPALDSSNIVTQGPQRSPSDLPWSITSLRYRDDNIFLVTLQAQGRGCIFVCKIDNEDPLEVIPSIPEALATYDISRSGKLHLFGTFSGGVRVEREPIDPCTDPPSVPRPACTQNRYHWECPLHDSGSTVTAVKASFDDCFLLSAATDGSMFVHEIRLDGSPTLAEGEPTIAPTASLEQQAEVADITTATEYSLEEAKQRAKEDRLLAAARERKAERIQQLDDIRSGYLALLKANEQLPENERLPQSELEIDPGLRALVADETRAIHAQAEQELRRESERRQLAVDKLRRTFLDAVEVERTVLHALKSGRRVTTFRVAKLSSELEREIAEAHCLNLKHEDPEITYTSSAIAEAPSMPETTQDKPGHADAKETPSSAADVHSDGLQSNAEKPLAKQELRRLQRRKQEEDLKAFNKTKPNDNHENEEDIRAIEHARSSMGDFKLKSDPDYSVPEEQRVTTMMKRRQMVLLNERVHASKMDFNRRLLALRETKEKTCKQIISSNKKILEIDELIGETSELLFPQIQPNEYPERRFTVTPEEIMMFEEEKRQRAVITDQREARGGVLGFDGACSNDSTEKCSSDVQLASTATDTCLSREPGGIAGDCDPNLLSVKPRTVTVTESVRIHLRYEKDALLDRINQHINEFDEAVDMLRCEKVHTEAELKNAEIQLLILYQELLLAKDFEKRETSLKAKHSEVSNDKADTLAKISTCQRGLEAKQREVAHMATEQKQLHSEFDKLVEEGHPFRDVLLKTFMRRIKRHSQLLPQQDEDYESEDDDFEETDLDFDEEDEDDYCPDDCDQTLYDKVCDLREERLDLENAIGDIQKQLDGFKKDKDALMRKQKTSESALKAIDKEMQELQKQKQNKLNHIDVVVALKMHQIEYLWNGAVPDDLSQGLVFSRTALQCLRSRVQELIDEKMSLRKQQRELEKHHANLLREQKVKEGRIKALETRAYDVQMLKFGQIVDLDLLDRMSVCNDCEEVKESLKKQEANHAKELRSWQHKIEAANKELEQVTRENTDALNRCGTGLVVPHPRT
eukprot:scaffold302_cov397-Prasinococcus_capsulatus_cf.AAC.7